MNPQLLKQNDFGWSYQHSDFLAHFGNIGLTKESLNQRFSNIKDFAFTHQVHGNDVLVLEKEPLDSKKADSIVTESSGVAICIRTADCAPILIYDSAHRKIGAVHAGWRGVANRAVEVAIKKMNQHYGTLGSDCIYLIGPHIQKTSFEVELDVRDQILSSLPSSSKKENFYDEIDNKKYLVDLNKVLLAQIQNIGCSEIINLKIDTFTNSNLHSYRRDKQNSGRLISFIALL